ncbi:MAG TPA: peptidoglycan-binding domain-containing protein [Candidatus Nanoarchaeia archaeon]|nr:peptidoglycan-binding domain-containing protein [Candidatus Nanoarchaeia archaeon]
MATVRAKTKFNPLVFLALAILAVGVYMIYRSTHAAVSNPYACPAGSGGSPHPLLQPNHISDANGNDLFRSDNCVRHMQFYLQNLGYSNIVITGIYDGSTVQAVKDFQQSTRCGCPPTGKADKATWLAIHAIISPVTPPPPAPVPAPPAAPPTTTTTKSQPAPTASKAGAAPALAAPTTEPSTVSKPQGLQLPAVIDITKFPSTTPLVSDAARKKAEPFIIFISLLLVGWMFYLLRMLYRQFVLPNRPRSKRTIISNMPKPTIVMPTTKPKRPTKTKRK